MNDRYFLDTNIFVYSFDDSDKKKQEISKQLIGEALLKNSGVISFQVIQEFINVMLRKFKISLTIDDIKVYLNSILMPLCEVFPNTGFYEKALEIHEETGFSFFDSLILAGAVEGRCSMLYSEDLQDSRVFRNVIIKNPYK